MSGLAATARRGVSWSALAVGGSALASMLQLAVAARFLSTADFGVMALVVVVVRFSENVSDLGMGNAILHRQGASRDELSSVFWLNAALGVALCAAVGASGPVLAALWDAPDLAVALPVAGLVFLASGAGQVALALLRRELRYRRLAAIDLVQSSVGLVLVSGLAMIGYGVMALVTGLVVGRCVRVALGLWFARHLFTPAFHCSRSDLAPFVDFGVFQVGERFVTFASRNLDKLIIGSLLGTELLGIYHLAYRLMTRPYRVISAVSGRITLPLLASLQHDRERLLGAYLTGIRILTLVAAPIFVGAALLAGPLVALVYGPGWSEVAGIFPILAPLGIFYVVGNLDGALVIATGKARTAFRWNAFSAAIHVTAMAIGIGFGLRGVAFSVLLATLLVLLPCAFYLRWILVGLRPRAYLASVGRPLGHAAVMALAVHALARVLGEGAPLLELLTLGVFGAMVYGALLWTRERVSVMELRGG